jgi:GGDEF domain-containing protein
VALLSIRKYLTDYGTESTNPFLRVSTLLLEGIAKAALAYDREEYAEFSATLHKLAAMLVATQDVGELLTVAESAAEAMESYNRGAQQAHAAQTVELRCMIEMLTQALVALAEAGGQSVQNLQSIRNQVEGARQLDDIRVLRARLGDSLKSLSDEARKQRERNDEILRHVAEAAALLSSQNREPEIDRVSGLPSREKAEDEIKVRVGPDSRYYAAVFVVERVESINLRYGYAAGDQLLQAFGRYLGSKLAAGDEVFRWRGPTFLVLLDRTCPVDAVRAEIGRLVSSPQEYTLQVDGWQMKLPSGCAWTVVELAKCQVADHATQQIDRFVAEHWEKRG